MKKKWVRAVLMICLILPFYGRQIQADDGGFKLKSDIISNEEVNSADIGDFPIRAQLFLDKMNQQAAQLKEKSTDVGQIQSKIDFLSVSSGSSSANRKEMAALFQNYQPSIVVMDDEAVIAGRNWTIVGLSIFFLGIAVFGAYLGSWWAKRRRQQTV